MKRVSNATYEKLHELNAQISMYHNHLFITGNKIKVVKHNIIIEINSEND